MSTKQPAPPKWAVKLLGWFCTSRHYEILMGDLDELFHERVQHQGVRKAQFRYILDVLDLIRPFALKRKLRTSFNLTPMFKNFLAITYRNFLRQKVYSTINIVGLAIGISSSTLIYLYVQDEMSYDSMHREAPRIYRVLEYYQKDGVGERSASNAFPMGPAISMEYPHLIKQYVRFFNFQAPILSLKNRENNVEFGEKRLFLADSTLFEVFDFELVVGNEQTALDGPNKILLTESLAYKYFGYEDPLGKQLVFQGDKLLTVSGILKDPPTNLHIQFDGLVSFSTVNDMIPQAWMERFYWNPCWTYVLLHKNSDRDELAAQLPLFVQKYFPESKRDHITLDLQPLQDIHLTSNLDYEIRANGNMNNIYVLGTISLFVLLIASINFINLSSARATKRAKEVGIRKTLGSARALLMLQFIFESIVYTLVAAVMALCILWLAIPAFNAFTEKSIELTVLLEPFRLIIILVVLVTTGFLSGLYPAFILSSFKPIKVLRGGASHTGGGLGFRKLLVTFQFIISILLIAGTIVAVRQLDLLQNNDLGFQKEQVVMITAFTTSIGEQFETFRNELQRNPAITSVTAIEEVLGAKNQVGFYHFEGMDDGRPFPRLSVRHDFLKTFDMQLAAGRSYSRDFETDDSQALLVNEALVRSMNWGTNDDAVGKSFKNRRGPDGRIVGVVKDFNYASKHVPIAPLVMDLRLNPTAFNLFLKYIAVRVDGQEMSDTLEEMERKWKAFVPNRPFDYFFLDARLTQSYKDEMKLSQLTAIFSGLAIFVACLGLFGLTTFIVEQRTKEIGIRKILGIDPWAIVGLLTRDFIILIVIAVLVAAPLSYLLLEEWLDAFAYRIDPGLGPIAVAGVVVLIIAMVTVSLHSLKAININPVQTLKSE